MVVSKHLDSLMMFPLSDVVLFPHTELPLHIFEPRYRQMVSVAIENNAPIGMATVKSEADPPDVHEEIGIGMISQHEILEDGRYVIVLEGITRARIEQEHDSPFSYRLVSAIEIEDDSGDEEDLRNTMIAVEELVRSFRVSQSKLSEFLEDELEDCEKDPNIFSNRVGAMLCSSTSEKLTLFRETDPNRRLDFVLGRLSEIVMSANGSDAKN